MNYVKVVAVSA